MNASEYNNMSYARGGMPFQQVVPFHPAYQWNLFEDKKAKKIEKLEEKIEQLQQDMNGLRDGLKQHNKKLNEWIEEQLNKKQNHIDVLQDANNALLEFAKATEARTATSELAIKQLKHTFAKLKHDFLQMKGPSNMDLIFEPSDSDDDVFKHKNDDNNSRDSDDDHNDKHQNSKT